MASISGTGCCVVDYLYTNIDFNSETFKKYQSKKAGDGGLNPGHLSFVEAWEKFAGKPLDEIRKEQGWMRDPDNYNLGGPCIVALVNAAQLTSGVKAKVKYFGGRGRDETGDRIVSILKKTPVDISGYKPMDGSSPFCVCLSDPNYSNGHGERSFAINLGTMAQIGVSHIGDDFFKSDILYFGATALTPVLHDNLTSLLRRGKREGKINVVGTVYDHRNQARNPKGRWPMGESDDSFIFMDLLMVDWEEALRISGAEDIADACQFFVRKGVNAFTITHGAELACAWSSGKLFKPMPISWFPICDAVTKDLAANPSARGDTTGCGDNFAGGMLAFLSEELGKGKTAGELDLAEGVAWGVASGGFACFTVGGTYIEKEPGEKRKHIDRYIQLYKAQIKTRRGAKL
ncbi:pfkB family carbohydrate kinase [Novymonas esmeraldas]|uniref:PfkB family carbohydrate kinase n=1 Tax=Novymonas esmeraldas TaxID=1808958 RepID=A0AAW0ER12_9TRYP